MNFLFAKRLDIKLMKSRDVTCQASNVLTVSAVTKHSCVSYHPDRKILSHSPPNSPLKLDHLNYSKPTDNIENFHNLRSEHIIPVMKEDPSSL